MNMNTLLSRKPGLIAADMNGSTVMMDITTGKYYNLGEIGGAIWALLENSLTAEGIINGLMQQYNIDRETCEKDTMKFLETLLNKGLLVKE